jgi:beta-N-acetylhexosaminidase
MLEIGPGQTKIENDIRQSKWIVFVMLDTNNPEVASAGALEQFLAQRLDLLQQKNLIAFALNAPYYLGATDISKLTAYYGLYSRSSQFTDIAARLLFQELRASAAPPVSISGANYNLNQALFPDPSQIIPLFVDLPEPTPTEGTATPMPTLSIPEYRLGDSIPLRTGIILDYNKHPVPDGTPVRFFFNYSSGVAQQVEVQTFQGVARTAYRVDSTGGLQIRVESEPAKTSAVLTFNIPVENVTATVVPPTPTPTETPTPTPTLTPTSTPTLTPTITPTPTPTPEPIRAEFGDWLAALLVAAGIGMANFALARWAHQFRRGIRGLLLAVIGGLIAYSYLALEMPGSQALLSKAGLYGVIGITLVGALVGCGAAWIWPPSPGRNN